MRHILTFLWESIPPDSTRAIVPLLWFEICPLQLASLKTLCATMESKKSFVLFLCLQISTISQLTTNSRFMYASLAKDWEPGYANVYNNVLKNSVNVIIKLFPSTSKFGLIGAFFPLCVDTFCWVSIFFEQTFILWRTRPTFSWKLRCNGC